MRHDHHMKAHREGHKDLLVVAVLAPIAALILPIVLGTAVGSF